MKPTEALEAYAAWMARERLAKLTIESYLGWAERFLAFVGGRPKPPKDQPRPTVEEAVSEFLSSYQTHSEATVKQALNALAGKSGLYAAPSHIVTQ